MLGKAISRKTLSNYLIAIIFTFAITSFTLTYYVYPTYAAPNVSTFFSCETSDGCAYRYNTTQYLAPLPNNMTAIGNWSTSSLVYQMLGNETYVINGSAIQRTTPFALLHLSYTPAINGTMGLHIVTDLNGQPNTESLEIEVNASSISAGFPTVFSAFVDKGASTGGDIHSFNTLAVGTGTIQVVGLGVFSGIDPIHQHSGSTSDMDRALIYDGSFSDVTAAFIATGNDTSIFVSVDDSVYIGDNSQFGEIQFNLDTIASGAGIRPTFEFSTGAGGWTVFSPIDGTDGMRADGGVAYEKNDLTGWAVDTISGFGPHFWIRINRTQIGLGTIPIEDLVQIVVDTDFIWDENGNVEIFGMNVTDVLGLSSGNGVIILSGGRPVLFTPTYPATNNWNGTWAQNNFGNTGNDFGTTNALVATTMSGSINMGSNSLNTVFQITGRTDATLEIYGRRQGATAIQIFTPGVGPGFADTLRLGIQSSAAIIDIDMTNADFDINGNNIKTNSNNTGSIGSDAVRIANIFSTVDTAKTQVTGLLLESDIAPNIGESFNQGDIVCIYKAYSFTKCNKDNDTLVLGPVYMLSLTNITRYETEIKSIDGKDVINHKPIWEEVGTKILVVIEGPLNVKACGTILKGQFLVAGAGGCAKGVDSLTPELRYFGLAVENSKDGWVAAYMP